jgi:hypothetical protein
MMARISLLVAVPLPLPGQCLLHLKKQSEKQASSLWTCVDALPFPFQARGALEVR